MVIFGAGASYDSDPRRPPPTPADVAHRVAHHDPTRPPLAQDLFANRYGYAVSLFQQCRPLINRLRITADNLESIESKLSEFDDEAGTYPIRKVQLAAIRSYLRRIISQAQVDWIRQCDGVTNYVELVDLLQQLNPTTQRICYVTFNYDTMLEIAIRNATSKRFVDMASYFAQPGPIVIKPHGCITWSQRVYIPLDCYSRLLEGGTPEDQESALIDLIPDIRMGEIEYNLAYQPVRNQDFQQRTADFALPAIAVPFDQKSSFLCPQDHLTILQKVLPEVTHILIIGWRGTEELFVQALARGMIGRRVHGTIVNGDLASGEQTVTQLLGHGVDAAHWNVASLTFSEMLRKLDLATLFA